MLAWTDSEELWLYDSLSPNAQISLPFQQNDEGSADFNFSWLLFKWDFTQIDKKKVVAYERQFFRGFLNCIVWNVRN